MGKWFGQAREIEQLRAENASLRAEVARLQSLLRSGLTEESVAEGAGSNWAGLALNAEENTLLQQGQEIAAIKAYRERTGAGLLEAKRAIDAAKEQ